MNFEVQPLKPEDAAWVTPWLTQRWAAPRVVARGRIHQADRLPGFVAADDSGPIGLATYHLDGDQCELVTLDSLAEQRGVGTALVAAVKNAARAAGCRRLWLITTNDNTHAMRFYQKRGFVLAALHRNALDTSRRLKPEIPLVGIDGIPLRDELEFEMIL